MKSFKTYIIEKLKVVNDLTDAIAEDELEHIASILKDFIEELAFQNDEEIENTIDELKDSNVYDCLSYWNDSVEDFIDFFNNNSVKKYSKKELDNILSDHTNELTEIVLRKLDQ